MCDRFFFRITLDVDGNFLHGVEMFVENKASSDEKFRYSVLLYSLFWLFFGH